MAPLAGGGEASAPPPASASPGARLDLQTMVQWLEYNLPYIVLLLLLFVQSHLLEILFTACLFVSSFKATEAIKNSIARVRSGNDVLANKLGFIVIHLMVTSVATLGMFSQEKLWHSLVLVPPRASLVEGLWGTLFRCLMVDGLLRQMSAAVKITVLCLWKPQPGKMFRKQGQVLTSLEYGALLYSTLAPVPIWCQFFQSNQSLAQWLSSTSTGFYLTIKATSIYERGVLFYGALRTVLRPHMQYGQAATKEDVMEVGDTCAICQESMMDLSPVKLHCSHIFCEECIHEWLDRDSTCPLCRAAIRSSSLRSFSDGSTGTLLQLF